jgi:hypothetical protein
LQTPWAPCKTSGKTEERPHSAIRQNQVPSHSLCPSTASPSSFASLILKQIPPFLSLARQGCFASNLRVLPSDSYSTRLEKTAEEARQLQEPFRIRNLTNLRLPNCPFFRSTDHKCYPYRIAFVVAAALQILWSGVRIPGRTVSCSLSGSLYAFEDNLYAYPTYTVRSLDPVEEVA